LISNGSAEAAALDDVLHSASSMANHAVASTFLGFVERLVRLGEQALERLGAGAADGNPKLAVKCSSPLSW
jgi:hypothetical protein